MVMEAVVDMVAATDLEVAATVPAVVRLRFEEVAAATVEAAHLPAEDSPLPYFIHL